MSFRDCVRVIIQCRIILNVQFYMYAKKRTTAIFLYLMRGFFKVSNHCLLNSVLVNVNDLFYMYTSVMYASYRYILSLKKCVYVLVKLYIFLQQ